MDSHMICQRHFDRSKGLACPRRSFVSSVTVLYLGFAFLFSACFAVLCLAADLPRVHGAPLDEAADFYQYTDQNGGVHFVDSPEKIPRHYRNKVTVRKELPSARQTTKVVVADRQIHVPVTFTNGSRSIQAVLLLDTGASITCISEELAARLNFHADSYRAGTARLADGSEIAIRLANVDSLSVGARAKAPFEIGVMQHKGSPEMHDGVLGLDFLGDFQYQIDLPNELIRWQ
jgi:hypothetical protein